MGYKLFFKSADGLWRHLTDVKGSDKLMAMMRILRKDEPTLQLLWQRI